MVAQVSGLEAGEFIHSFGDTHLYANHLEQADEQLERAPDILPQLHINPDVTSIFDFTYDDFTIHGYHPQSHIAAKVAV